MVTRIEHLISDRRAMANRFPTKAKGAGLLVLKLGSKTVPDQGVDSTACQGTSNSLPFHPEIRMARDRFPHPAHTSTLAGRTCAGDG